MTAFALQVDIRHPGWSPPPSGQGARPEVGAVGLKRQTKRQLIPRRN
jgi:hypothetical protein